MTIEDQFRAIVEPLVEGTAVELVDVEFTGGVLRVTVDQPGGVGIGDIARLTRKVNEAVDEADPVQGRYTLEVSSPGLERPLRRPEHFRSAVGSDVVVKTRPQVEGDRRIAGTLTAAGDDSFTVRDSETLVERTLRYDEIDKARTTFEWGPAPKPGAGRNKRKKASAR